MAIYRNIQMSFWTDTKIADEFTSGEKYLYLYLMTNPHTNLAGCYEISVRQIAYETGMTAQTVKAMIGKLQNDHDVIRYSGKTKEVLLLNWSKYNWTASEKLRKPLYGEIADVKDDQFREYLTALFDGIDTVSIPYTYGSDTTVTDTDTVTVSVKSEVNKVEPRARTRESQTAMFDRLITGRAVTHDMQDKLREWIVYKQERNEPYKETGMKSLITQAVNNGAAYGGKAVTDAIDYSMASGYKGIVWDRVGKSPPKSNKFLNENRRNYDYDDLERALLASN